MFYCFDFQWIPNFDYRYAPLRFAICHYFCGYRLYTYYHKQTCTTCKSSFIPIVLPSVFLEVFFLTKVHWLKTVMKSLELKEQTCLKLVSVSSLANLTLILPLHLIGTFCTSDNFQDAYLMLDIHISTAKNLNQYIEIDRLLLCYKDTWDSHPV